MWLQVKQVHSKKKEDEKVNLSPNEVLEERLHLLRSLVHSNKRKNRPWADLRYRSHARWPCFAWSGFDLLISKASRLCLLPSRTNESRRSSTFTGAAYLWSTPVCRLSVCRLDTEGRRSRRLKCDFFFFLEVAIVSRSIARFESWSRTWSLMPWATH